MLCNLSSKSSDQYAPPLKNYIKINNENCALNVFLMNKWSHLYRWLEREELCCILQRDIIIIMNAQNIINNRQYT